jgi:hypothetical protein
LFYRTCIIIFNFNSENCAVLIQNGLTSMATIVGVHSLRLKVDNLFHGHVLCNAIHSTNGTAKQHNTSFLFFFALERCFGSPNIFKKRHDTQGFLCCMLGNPIFPASEILAQVFFFIYTYTKTQYYCIQFLRNYPIQIHGLLQ